LRPNDLIGGSLSPSDDSLHPVHVGDDIDENNNDDNVVMMIIDKK